MEWRGASLLPIYIFVCRDCLDIPQEQLRAIALPADPIPIQLPFPETFVPDEVNYMTLTTGSTVDPITGIPIPATTTMATVSGLNMTPEPYGRPDGLDQRAIMPLQIVDGVPTAYGVPVPVLSVISNGTDQIAVTCSAAHGLSTDDQIAVEGLANNLANGFFSIVVTTATAFTYQTYSTDVPSGSLLTATTRMVTANIGLPYDYDQIAQVGP
jgi:hypothetical protein